MANENKWIEQKSDHWEANSQAWRDAMTVYMSDLKQLRNSKYLIQRVSGEDTVQFQERLRLADFMPVFAIVADTYAGRMLEAEKQINRIWQGEDSEDGLGDPKDPNTLAGKLWRQADGGRTSWLTMIEDAIILMVVCKEHYAVVRGVNRDKKGKVTKEPSCRLIEPWAVEDAIEDDGRLVEAKVFHKTNVQRSVKQMKDVRDRYTLYLPEGFEVWEKDAKGGNKWNVIQQITPYGIVDGKPFRLYADRDRKEPILPIFRNELSLRRKPGCNLADKNLVLFNQESKRDNILTVANTPRLQFVGDYGKFTQFLKENDAGSNVLVLDPNSGKEHRYITPGMDSAKIATEVIDKKIEGLFLSAFRYYEDAVRGKARTATEVEQDSAGENGFLNVLATGADNLENGLGMRFEQIQFPNNPDLWGQFRVERKKDFTPINERGETDAIIARYFGKQTPVLTEDAEIELTIRAYQQDGLSADKDQIAREVRARRGERDIARERAAIGRDRDRALAEADGAEIAARQREIEQAAAGV